MRLRNIARGLIMWLPLAGAYILLRLGDVVQGRW